MIVFTGYLHNVFREKYKILKINARVSKKISNYMVSIRRTMYFDVLMNNNQMKRNNSSLIRKIFRITEVGITNSITTKLEIKIFLTR